jgi:hypothetical protein
LIKRSILSTSLRASGSRRIYSKTSLPGLTRQSILFEKTFCEDGMDARIKSGHDKSVCVRTNDAHNMVRSQIRISNSGRH